MQLVSRLVAEILDEDVLWLHVSVHDLNIVTEVECQQDLVDQVADLLRSQGRQKALVFEAALKTATFHQLLHYVEIFLVVEELVYARYVRVRYLFQDLELVLIQFLLLLSPQAVLAYDFDCAWHL